MALPEMNKRWFVLFLMILVVAVLGILMASLFVSVNREGVVGQAVNTGLLVESGVGSYSSSVSDSGKGMTKPTPSIQAVQDIYHNIQADFVSTMATELAAIQLKDLVYPSKQQFQDDLTQIVSDLPIPPLLSKEYILGYYQQLTDAAINYKSSNLINDYKTQMATQFPLRVHYVVDNTISNYDTKIASFMNKQNSEYSSTFL